MASKKITNDSISFESEIASILDNTSITAKNISFNQLNDKTVNLKLVGSIEQHPKLGDVVATYSNDNIAGIFITVTVTYRGNIINYVLPAPPGPNDPQAKVRNPQPAGTITCGLTPIKTIDFPTYKGSYPSGHYLVNVTISERIPGPATADPTTATDPVSTAVIPIPNKTTMTADVKNNGTFGIVHESEVEVLLATGSLTYNSTHNVYTGYSTNNNYFVFISSGKPLAPVTGNVTCTLTQDNNSSNVYTGLLVSTPNLDQGDAVTVISFTAFA